MKTPISFFLTSILIFIFTSCSKEESLPGSILEIINNKDILSTETLLHICDVEGIKAEDIKAYKQHWVVYNSTSKIEEVKSELERRFPSLGINFYDVPFYNFNRFQLTNENPAKEWTHIVMTANLVSDTILQNEYMEYHRTQFEKWPEVSKGFCNADFQQVLVFRNGRQLMLVISIPKGETLDELNPKTTENNPRVDEWNKMMAKYQEGIEDAPKGTTWVMFQSIIK